MTPSENLKVGTAGERIGADFLKARGLKIIFKNYRCRAGEIDLVAREGATLVFVEVKTRRSHEQGEGWEAVSFFKKKSLIRSATHFLQRYGIRERVCRFDVLSVSLKSLGGHEITWIQDAFWVGSHARPR